MARTTASAVEGICDVIEDTDLDPYILPANELVTEVCVPAGYSDERLELIERWLAAHFYCVFDPRAQSESAGVSASYEGTAGMYLERTRYGQMAMILDTAGGLAQLNTQTEAGKVRTLSISWLGSTPREQRAYVRETEDEQ